MRIVRHILRSCAWLALLFAVEPAHADGSANTAGPLRAWCIQRLPDPGDLDNDSLQLIAQQIGSGRFYVRAAGIAEAGPAAEGARVLFVYSSADDAGKNQAPLRRIFYGGAGAKMWIRPGGDEQLVSGFFQSRCRQGGDDTAAVAIMSNVLSAVLYSGRARLLDGGLRAFSGSEITRLRTADPAGPDELRTLARAPAVSRDASGKLTWQGRFLRADGGIEDVTAILPVEREGLVRLQRVEVKPCGSFPEILGREPAPEKWIVGREVSWSVPKRYGLMLTLASLGNTRMKYRLATILMQDNDGSSVAEGIKWLNSAAADGYRDAVERLAAISSGPLRQPRDRELVRMNWCDCSARRTAAK